jgi:hypothetical protein
MLPHVLMRKFYPARSEGSPVHQLCLRLLFALVAFTAVSAPITEIRLVRTACYGVCPDDELTIRSDGTATYRGMKSDRPGDYRGALPRDEARALLRRIDALGFAKLPREFGQPNIDAPDYVVIVNGKKVVSHMQQSREIAPIITAILGTSEKVKWTPERTAISGTLPPKTPYSVKCGARTYHALSDATGHYRLPLRHPRSCGKVSSAIFRAPHV